MFGAGMKHSDYHTISDLPLVIAGGGGGQLKAGRFLNYPNQLPMCDLLLAMINLFGRKTKAYGSSTTPLKGLTKKIKLKEVKDDGSWKVISKTGTHISLKGHLVINPKDAGRSYLLKLSKNQEPILIKAGFGNLLKFKIDDNSGCVALIEGEFKMVGGQIVLTKVTKFQKFR